jgi:hypothetical protein
MNKLNSLLDGDVLDFAAAFAASNGESLHDATPPGCPVWLEGWVAPARAGYVLGDGEFIYEGQARRFQFSGLPLRHGRARRVSGAGIVSCLRTLAEFSGTFLPCDAATAGAGRRRVALLRNEHGVMIELFASDGNPLADLPEDALCVRLWASPTV